MVEVNVSYPDFSGGEVSPDLYGRFDLSVFYKGARRIENFVTYSTGSAKYRTGSIYSSRTRLGNKARLHTFKVSEAVSYTLEFTDLFLRFHRNGGQVRTDPQNITSISKASPAVVTYAGANTFSNGDSVFITGGDMTQVNDLEFIVANVNTGAKTFELQGINSTAYTTYTGGGTVEKIVEVATPYTEANVFGLKFGQDVGGLMYIAHESHNPRILTITDPVTWSLDLHSPVRKSFANSQNITAISQANPAVVTYAGADNFTNGDEIKITDVQGMIQINNAADERYTVANVNAAANTFELSGVDSTGYSAYTSDGFIQREIEDDAPFLVSGSYPRAVGFYEQRLIYGGSDDAPQTLYFSKPAEPNDFSIGDEIDDGLEYTIAGDVGRINWLQGTERFLGIGCADDVVQATGGIDGVITPTSISIRPSNSSGAQNIMAIGRGSQVFYMQSNSLVLRSFEYDFERDSYFPIDRNTVADHITRTGVSQIYYQEARPTVVWGIRNDGVLIGMTIQETEGVSGWHRQSTTGEYVSIAAEVRQNDYERLWACVKRDDVHYIEYFSDRAVYPRREDYVTDNESEDNEVFRNILFEAQKQYIHVDGAISYYGDALGLAAGATMTPSAITGDTVTFTASASVFDSSMVGRQIWRKYITGLESGRAEITAYTSSTVVTCKVLEDFDSTDAIPAGEWYLTSDSFSGITHLTGMNTVVADGGQHAMKTVTDGIISLDRQASVVHVGKGYTGYLETNDLEGGGSNGTAQTKKKNVKGVGFRFLDTLYAKYGTSYYKLRQIEIRTPAMKMDRPPELFTGDTKETYANDVNDSRNGGWSRSKRAIVSQDQPFPCNVQLVVPYMSVSN